MTRARNQKNEPTELKKLYSKPRRQLQKISKEGITEDHITRVMSERKKDIAQYKACIALMMSREEILQTTKWPPVKLYHIERQANNEDRVKYTKVDARETFSEYQLMQMLVAKELAYMSDKLMEKHDIKTAITAKRAQSEIYKNIIAVGQELGVITRESKKIDITTQVDFKSMSVVELKEHLKVEYDSVQNLLGCAPSLDNVTDKVLKNVLQKDEAIETTAEPIKKSKRIPVTKKFKKLKAVNA